MKVLILGASYGALLGVKLVMAGHDVTLVCRAATAALINAEGLVLRLTLKGEATPRVIRSVDWPGRVAASPPAEVKAEEFDLVALAMQEPQYSDGEVRALLSRVAAAKRPCLSIMNMPPPPFLRRIPALATLQLDACYTDVSVWEPFTPGLVTLCSPDPQAFRPPEEPANVVQVTLPTNFKAAAFEDPTHTALLTRLEADIDAVRLEGHEVPVKLRVHNSLFVPLAKWSMLLTGNYRCITPGAPIPIQQAVHGDLEASRQCYEWVDALARTLGAAAEDQVPFEKYATAAQSLHKPSSVARALDSGTANIERVDLLVQAVAAHLNLRSELVDTTVATVNAKVAHNRSAVPGGH